MRISDCSSDVCPSDLRQAAHRIDARQVHDQALGIGQGQDLVFDLRVEADLGAGTGSARGNSQVIDFRGMREIPAQPGEQRQAENDLLDGDPLRSEEHTSELQSLMRISYAVICLKKQTQE